jgi:probable HAF family extracellular repeat protein
MHRNRFFLSLMLLVGGVNARAGDKAFLIELEQKSGALPGGVSATGAVVAGGFSNAGAFYWMPTTGAVNIGGLTATRVSRDGSTIVGIAADGRGSQAAIWKPETQWRLLGSFTPGALSCGASLSSASGTSGDGKVVVGLGWNGCNFAHAFRWDDASGMTDLGSSVANRASRADAVSEDGKVVVGYQEDATGFSRGAQWVNGTQSLFVGPGTGGLVGTAKAANHDGSVVVGRVCNPNALTAADPTFQSAWVWTTQEGLKCLPVPKIRPSPGPVIIAEARATSDDGSVIGGSQNVGGSDDSNAVIWINRVPYYLKDYLQSHGVPDAFATWVNTGTITDISPDGRVIVGYGAALLGFRGYIVVLGDKR